MARIIAVTHHAGGVGKTTTVLNMGYALAASGCKVLLADLDPQADLTLRLGIDVDNLRLLVTPLTTGGRGPEVVYRHWDGVAAWVLPSDVEQMAGVELQLGGLQRREDRLGRILAGLHLDYDFIILDCPPSLNMLTVNALYAAQDVLIPVQAQDKALRQLAPLLKSIEEVQSYRSGPPAILGMLITMVDKTRQAVEAERALRDVYQDWVFTATIPTRTVTRDDGQYHAPVGVYAPHSPVTAAYAQLAQEVMTRVH